MYALYETSVTKQIEIIRIMNYTFFNSLTLTCVIKLIYFTLKIFDSNLASVIHIEQNNKWTEG